MNEQREAVVQRLSEHFAADRLSLDELERRLDLVFQAKSPADLAQLTADLPATAPAPLARPASHPVSQGTTGAQGIIPRRIRALLGNVERSGPFDVPERLEVSSLLGNAELDLRDAHFGPFTEIAIRSILGNVEIVLPSDVRVENDGNSLLGSFVSDIAPGAMPMVGTSPVVRLTGRAVLGNVEVRAVAGREFRGHQAAIGRAERPL